MRTAIVLTLASALAAPAAFADGAHTATLDVANMDCAVCPITVRKALEKVSGVQSAKVDLKTKSAVVTFDPAKVTPQELTRATGDAGYPSTIQRLQ